jgi:hypothetical protein
MAGRCKQEAGMGRQQERRGHEWDQPRFLLARSMMKVHCTALPLPNKETHMMRIALHTASGHIFSFGCTIYSRFGHGLKDEWRGRAQMVLTGTGAPAVPVSEAQ